MHDSHLRALIVDDEPIARSKLRKLLRGIPGLTCVGEAADGHTAVQIIDAERPDVVFLDIQLPGQTGIDVLRDVRHRPAVIFTTAFDRYAVTAFELQAVDYLLKPFGRRRLLAALERVRPPRRAPSPARGEDVARATSGDRLDRLYVRDRGRIVPIPVETIDRLESCGDYVGVWTGGRRHLIHIALRDVVERLDSDRFVRIHRSHVINLDRVRDVQSHPNGRLRVTMGDGSSVTASRARTPALRRRLR